jgi:GTP diphosphokinase / guanosine-3',5'-bis(diphosphate) 3'-diphosphatase
MLIIKAMKYAAEYHKDQIRRVSELPYIIHPMVVMELINKFKGDSFHIEELKCAALLHDVIEDTDCTYIELEREFGPMVSAMVMELTSDEESIRKVGKNNYLKVKMCEMSSYALILKLADRLSNILDSPGDEYVTKTIEMMDYIKGHRKDITGPHLRIMREIKETCEEIINGMER